MGNVPHEGSMIAAHVPRRGRPPLNLLGQRFGRLTVIASSPSLRYARWRCLCDCGAECVVSTQLLRMGKDGTRSCGCLRRETCRKNGHRFAEIMAERRRESADTTCTLAEVWR